VHNVSFGDAKELSKQIAQLLESGNSAAVLSLVEQLVNQRDAATVERDALETKVKRRDVEVTRLRRLLYGRRSEKLTHEELSQLVLSFGATEAEAAQADPKLPIPSVTDTEAEDAPKRKKARPNHKGRGAVSAAIERIVKDVPVPAGERNCVQCGAEMAAFGYVDHELVEYVPAKLVVHVERREKLGCKCCKGDAITAERNETSRRPLRVGPSFLTQLIESKCDDALPIHRQCDQFSRLGFELPTSTAYGYWRYVTDLLLPVSEALLGVVLEDPDWVGVDDTGLDVLDDTLKAGKYRGHLWCFRGSSGLVAYQFTPSWKADEIAPWFHAIGERTHIQVDDYKGYNTLIADDQGNLLPLVPSGRRLGCMMHVRRRFHDALKAGDKRAVQPVQWIQELYKVEERAKALSATERYALRQQHSTPVLDRFDKWVNEHKPILGNTSKLAKAVGYAQQQRPYIRRCFSDGRFEIDNGAVERAIREPAIGRKNFLFTGSADAAQRLAGAYTLVQTCRALGLSTRDYLIDVITRLEAGWSARRLTELLPHRWSALQT
jgi:transposase